MKKLWAEWLTLHRILEDVEPCHFQGVGISAPFMSVDSGTSDAPHKLLYVGQATSKEWYNREFREEHTVDTPIKRIIAERQRRNSKGVSGEYWGRGFWLTFRAMSKQLGNDAGEHSNALWTNLAKIGVSTGNPQGLVLSMQADLAARTVQSEIAVYRPSIVVFVTGTYGSSIVFSATKTTKRDWYKTEEDATLRLVDDNVWWIPRNNDTCAPAYLWTPHPSRGMSVARRTFWVTAALQLSEGKSKISTLV